jgi:hypothetical protein
MRELVEGWLRNRGGHLAAGEFTRAPRWVYVDPDPSSCEAP